MRRVLTIIIITVAILACSNQQKDPSPILTGTYLGQNPPGMMPKVFAPDIVSTNKIELNAVFSKNGKMFYFTRKNDAGLYQILEMKMEGDQWSKPHVAPFSGIYEEAEPFISYDGSLLNL